MRLGDGSRDLFELRRGESARAERAAAWNGRGAALPARWGRWRFRRVTDGTVAAEAANAADAVSWFGVSGGARVGVRPWEPGDRIRTAGAPAGRRVTRYFVEAGVPALDRPEWPVVLQAEEVVWVPGVCRSVAALYRPGWPDLIWYRCEREHD